MNDSIDQTYGEYYQRIIIETANKYKPEILALLCVSLGSKAISDIGLNVFNNRYISVPYIIIVGILYVLMRLEQNAKERISAN